MPISHFDKMLHTFTCENTKCSKTFQQVLRSLLNADKVICPECGTAIDIRESKRTGNIGIDFDAADQLDKQTRQEK